MASKRAKFKVEEISEDVPEVTQPEVTVDAGSGALVETPQEETPAVEVEAPKDLGTKPIENSTEEIKDWLKDVKPDTSKDVEKASGINLKLILFFMFLILIVGAVVGGFYYYNKGVSGDVVKDESEKAVPVTVVPTSEVSPTSAMEEKVVMKDLKVQILNGSGKVGEAGVVKTALIKLGFTAGNITTGNAASYDFKDTEVSFKEGVAQSLLEDIKKSLDKYTVVKAKSDLANDAKFDISITVGATK